MFFVHEKLGFYEKQKSILILLYLQAWTFIRELRIILDFSIFILYYFVNILYQSCHLCYTIFFGYRKCKLDLTLFF